MFESVYCVIITAYENMTRSLYLQVWLSDHLPPPKTLQRFHFLFISGSGYENIILCQEPETSQSLTLCSNVTRLKRTFSSDIERCAASLQDSTVELLVNKKYVLWNSESVQLLINLFIIYLINIIIYLEQAQRDVHQVQNLLLCTKFHQNRMSFR